MARKLTVVVSQGQSANPVKRKLEEDLVSALLFERGIEVTVVPHLYDLKSDGTGMLCLQGIADDMVVLSWLFPRAALWILDRNGIRGREGKVLLVDEQAEAEEDDEGDEDADGQAIDDKPRVIDTRTLPRRSIYCIDLRARNEVAAFVDEVRRIRDDAAVELVGLSSFIGGTPRPEQLARFLAPTNDTSPTSGAGVLDGSPTPTAPPAASGGSAQAQAGNGAPGDTDPGREPLRVADEAARRWYPVIDYSRCTNCMECIDFCLFGVYGMDRADTILVEQPDNCRKGCPACSRVCPENAIIFPQHKSPAIAGSLDAAPATLKIDLSKLFGAPDALELAVHERDVELVAAGRDAVGMSLGIPKRQPTGPQRPKDDLDKLIDQLDELGL